MFLAKEIRLTKYGGKCIILQDSPTTFPVSISYGNAVIGETFESPSSLDELNTLIDDLELQLISSKILQEAYMGSITYRDQTVTRENAINQVGSGWTGLVNEVYDILGAHPVPAPIVLQVKEKFGGLRIYTYPYNEEVDTLIEEISRRSFTICEKCGQAGELRSGNWYKTLCEEHSEGRPATTPF